MTKVTRCQDVVDRVRRVVAEVDHRVVIVRLSFWCRPSVSAQTTLSRHGISKTTFFKWRSKHAGASLSDEKRLPELEGENARLKRMYAELAFKNAAIKEVLARKL